MRLRSLVLALSAGLALACATVRPAPVGPVETGQLFLWEVERADGAGGVAHVLGTVHLSEEELHFDPAVDRALDDADTLVLEIAPQDMEPASLLRVAVEKGYFADGRTLDQVLAPETWRALEKRVADYGLRGEDFRPMEPWYALLTLQMLALQREGYDTAKGVETQLAASAEESGRPMQGLETPAEQLAVLDELPLSLQERQLREFLTADGADEGDLSVLIDAWRKGDDRRLEHELFAELERDPSLAPYYERFFFQRNDRMARGIAERVDSGGRWFVAVGAGHVVGARGIPSLLSQQGYRVTRIPKAQP